MIAAQRYNNPGNISLPITGWTGGHIVGLPDQPGYAAFPSMDIGYQAFKYRLGLFISGGRNTIRLIGARYAADPHWPVAVAALAGLGIDAPLDLNDAAQMDKLAVAIIKQETGMSLAQLIAGAIPSPAAPAANSPATTPVANTGPKIMPAIFAVPTIVHWIVTLLPGIPDDIALVEKELKELASTDDGVTKLKTALTFAQTFVAKLEAVIASATP
jgi:hypothetical protein